ncbi:MAG: hypothetical protein R3A52_05340 [Polyangiales bacterium]
MARPRPARRQPRAATDATLERMVMLGCLASAARTALSARASADAALASTRAALTTALAEAEAARAELDAMERAELEADRETRERAARTGEAVASLYEEIQARGDALASRLSEHPASRSIVSWPRKAATRAAGDGAS